MLVGRFMKDLRMTFNRYDIFRQAAIGGDEAAVREERRQGMEAWDRIVKEVSATRLELEREMRGLLEPIRPLVGALGKQPTQ